MTFNVTLTEEALEDLARLEDFLVELALRHGELELLDRAMTAIRNELRILRTNPFTCRIAGTDRLERELIIPFGAPGYVALFRILDEQHIAVLAVRHQREDDFH